MPLHYAAMKVWNNIAIHNHLGYLEAFEKTDKSPDRVDSFVASQDLVHMLSFP